MTFIKNCFLPLCFLFPADPSSLGHVSGIYALFGWLFFLFLSQCHCPIDYHLVICFIIIWEVSSAFIFRPQWNVLSHLILQLES